MQPVSGQESIAELQRHLGQLSQFFKSWVEQQEQLLKAVSAPSMGASESHEQLFNEGTTGTFDKTNAVPVWKEAPGVQSTPSLISSGCTDEKCQKEPCHEVALVERSASIDSDLSLPGSKPHMASKGHLTSQVSQVISLPKNWLWQPKPTSNRRNIPVVVESLMKTEKHQFGRPQLFSIVSCSVILYNSAIIAADIDYAMANPEAPGSSIFLKSSELACTIYYVIELAIRLCKEGMMFWKGFDWQWNVFDVCLAFQAVVDQTEQWSGWSIMGNMSNWSFFRLLRLLKTLRMLRIIRLMRAFRELRLILSSLFGCVKSFTWACTLLAAVCFMASIAIMQSCLPHRFQYFDKEDDFEAQIILKYWSSVPVSMLTLVGASFGGLELAEMFDALSKVSKLAYAVFLIFLGVWHFVILNIVNSMFIQNMMDTASRDSQMVIDNMMDEKQKYIEQLTALYETIDEDGDGEISYQEFCTLTKSAALRAFISSLGIDMAEAKHFFRVLSAGGKRPIDIQCFVDGSIKMRGLARSMDLLDLVYQHKLAVFEHSSSLKIIQERIDKMVRECTLLSTRLQKAVSQVNSKNLKDACVGTASGSSANALVNSSDLVIL